MSKTKYCVLLQALLITGAVGTCENPEIKYTTYTTEDATILTHIAYVCEFTVKCKSGTVSNLYALVNNIIQPIGKTGSNNQVYQISWTEPVKTARTGDFNIKIFDDDGFALYRKTQRAGDDLNSIPAFGSVNIHHPGAYKGPWISCECLVVAFSLIVCYYAIHFRSKLLS